MGVRFIKISVLYFVIGVSLGMYMSMNKVFTFTPVHVHINLLGWTAMTLFGLIYVVFPKAAETNLAKWHYWIHNISLPVMMVGLSLLVSGNENGHLPVAGGSTLLIFGILLFAINIWKNVKVGEESKQFS